MNGTMSFQDLYGGASPTQTQGFDVQPLEPILSGTEIAGWFIGIVILYAIYYTLTEFVL